VVLAFILLVLGSFLMAEVLIFGAAEKRSAYISIPAAAFLNFIFSGLFIKAGSLPGWLAPWAPSISLIRWNMQANFINQYEGNVAVFPTLPGGYSTYNSFLNLFGWGGKTMWFCIYMMLINLAVFKVASLFACGLSVQAQKGVKKSLRVDH
jgi:hypothetical protein